MSHTRYSNRSHFKSSEIARCTPNIGSRTQSSHSQIAPAPVPCTTRSPAESNSKTSCTAYTPGSTGSRSIIIIPSSESGWYVHTATQYSWTRNLLNYPYTEYSLRAPHIYASSSSYYKYTNHTPRNVSSISIYPRYNTHIYQNGRMAFHPAQ